MGGFAEGEGVQVDVGATISHSSITSCSFSAVPDISLSAISRAFCGFDFEKRPRTACFSLTSTRNILSNLDIHLVTDPPYRSQYDPASLQYMLDFFRNVASSIPQDSASSQTGENGSEVSAIEAVGGGAASTRSDDASKRAGIIVLREDLDFYAIPPRPDIKQAEMMEVKRAAARALLRQDGIFSGLKRSDEPGTTEAHLIEMLTAGYVFVPFRL